MGVQQNLDDLKEELVVSGNDKSVLFEECKNMKNETKELTLDLASITSEKSKLEDKLKAFCEENYDLKKKMEENSLDKLDNEKLLVEKLEKIAEKEDVILNLEKIVADLRCEVSGLEMKNSSLEGSLSSLQEELTTLLHNDGVKLREYENKLEVIEEEKKELNETCVILETRMVQAEGKCHTIELKNETKELTLDLASI